MIQFQKLNKRDPIEKVIIVSLDLALYQVNVLVDGQELLVSDKKGKPLRARNTLEIEALFEGYNVKDMVLRHESAYDEMVNQPTRQGSNRMEVPLGRNGLGLRAFKILCQDKLIYDFLRHIIDIPP